MEMEMEREDGEMSDDNDMVIATEEPEPLYLNKVSKTDDTDFTIVYKAEKDGVHIEKLEKVDAAKLDERANRFGLDLIGKRAITQKQIDELYTNIGIGSENERHFRFDTLHLNGVDGLTTKEIFEYLEDYKPVSLEWIDSRSCNVVCQDHISAALALLVHSREIRNEEIKNKIAESSKYHWREGMPLENNDYIFMRFATNSDKKEPLRKPDERPLPRNIDQGMDVSKNPWGDLCQTWGVYDHQEILNRQLLKEEEERLVHKPKALITAKNRRLAHRLGKRTYKSEEDEDSSSSTEWKSQLKAPRMRMRADDEESKYKKKVQHIAPVKTEEDEFSPLSIEVMNTNIPHAPKEMTKLSDKFKKHSNLSRIHQSKDSVHSRLGARVKSSDNDEGSSSEDSSLKSDRNVMSRVQKIRNNEDSGVWSRLETKEKSSRNDLRQILKAKTSKKSDDLRERLGKAKQSISLRIEVDNDFLDSD